MEQIIQLKAMRDAALERLQVNPDFKLANSLDALIKDLEAVIAPQVEAVQAQADDEVVDAGEEGLQETVEVAAETDVDTSLEEGALLEADEEATTPPAEADLAPETELAEEAGEQDEIVEAAPESVSDEAAAAIEALEAELSQSDADTEISSSQPG